MAGADGKTPELRPPSIKGMMRFWWRAINGHLSLEQLRKQEAEIFGTSDESIGRSKFALKVIYNSDLKTDLYEPVPTRSFKAQAFQPEQAFTLLLSANDNFKEFEKISHLLQASFILGGLGKRSRRGFGCVKIVQIDGKPDPQYNSINELFKLLDLSAPDTFVLNGNKIERIKPDHAVAEYPYIKEVDIGKAENSWEILTKKIGNAASSNDCYHTGFTEKPYRFASPVYVSVIKGNNDQYLPIITTLNCAFEINLNNLRNNQKKKDNTLQFKKAILS